MATMIVAMIPQIVQSLLVISNAMGRLGGDQVRRILLLE